MGAANALRARRRTPLRRATLMRALAHLPGALRPARRPRARHVRDHHADRLGAAREPAAAAAARHGKDATGGCARNSGAAGRRHGNARPPPPLRLLAAVLHGAGDLVGGGAPAAAVAVTKRLQSGQHAHGNEQRRSAHTRWPWCRAGRAQGGRIRSLKRSIPSPLHSRPRALEQVPQHRLQWLVRRRHRIVGKPFRAHPGQLLPLPRRHLALPLAARIEGHQQVKRLVAVTGKGQAAPDTSAPP